MKVFHEEKKITGFSLDPLASGGLQVEFIPEDVFNYMVINGELVKDLTVTKAEKILEIKAEAERRIGLLDWRLERAKEREALGIVGYETVNDIHQLKEGIRQWSNQIEVELMQLESIDAVNVFSVR